jgi:hypothetical protein
MAFQSRKSPSTARLGEVADLNVETGDREPVPNSLGDFSGRPVLRTRVAEGYRPNGVWCVQPSLDRQPYRRQAVPRWKGADSTWVNSLRLLSLTPDAKHRLTTGLVSRVSSHRKR